MRPTKYDRVESSYGLRDQRQRKFNFEEPTERKKKIRRGRPRQLIKLHRNGAFGSCSST